MKLESEVTEEWVDRGARYYNKAGQLLELPTYVPAGGAALAQTNRGEPVRGLPVVREVLVQRDGQGAVVRDRTGMNGVL